MALTVVDDTTITFAGEAITENCGTWTAIGSGTAAPGLCCDVFRVGCNSISQKLDAMCPSKGGLQITKTGCCVGINFCDSCVRRGRLVVWMNTTQALSDTAGTGGFTIRMGSDACNYSEWIMASQNGIPACCIPAYPGGWQRYTLDLEKTPDTTMCSPAWCCTAFFAFQLDFLTDISGNIKNYFIDQVRHLTAAEVVSACPAMATITGTVCCAGDLFQEIFESTPSACTSGIVTQQGGALNLNYSLDIGGASATGTFTSSCELITVGPNAQGIAGSLFLRFLGNACNVQTHRFGTEVGCGSASVGFGGGLIKAINGNTFGLIATCNDLDDVGFFGLVIDGADLIDWTDTVDKMVSTTITNTRKIDFGCGAEIRDGVITCGTEACLAIGQIEFLVGGPTCPEFRDMLLQNHETAMEWSINGPITLDLRNITYANNCQDLRFNHACGLLTVNVLECGGTPSTSDGGAGGTIVVNNNVCIVVNAADCSGVDVEGARVGIFTSPVCPCDCSLFEGSTNACGVFTDSFNFSCNVCVTTRVRLIGFVPNEVSGQITMCGLTVSVTLIRDSIVSLP